MAVAQAPRSAEGERVHRRREEILSAALDVFTRMGYHRATIEEIREASGASTGSIYHHFGGKEQLAAALYVEGLADYQESFRRALGGSRSAEDTITEIVRNHLRWVARNPFLAAFLLSSREAEVVEASNEALTAMNRALIAETRAWIDREVKRGTLRAMPTGLFYAVLIGPSQEFARQWLKTRDRRALAEAGRELPEAAWRAVKA
jgi:AcrR family transcriptional regulator